MRIEVQLTTERIVPPNISGLGPDGGIGALAEFSGVVRGEEDGRTITALEYEAYHGMALAVMRKLLEQLGQHHPCTGVWVIHRVGVVPVGEAAIWNGVVASHRREAFALLAEFMDQLKQDVPIWKRRALFAPATDTAAGPTP
ncbi:MAG: molybdenum cofactor biosynthesis protein MoaE [Verrucomicrobiae bacterium]|nr:molybdenum cofactor biosynthesis protein MoaE [Verrucomicrobiae bacterium]